ncbi:MAG: hypothetical protein KBC91_03510 [Candidatus Omnitrophica bacterium]|nr:hypothetical protein [Candidatus Omnitrophota bacterium]
MAINESESYLSLGYDTPPFSLFLRHYLPVALLFLLLTSNFQLLTASESSVPAPNPKALFKQADVVLEVIPLRARPIERGVSVDAVESDPARLALAEAVVSFKIRRVLKGEWLKDRVGGPTRLEQLEKAVRKKDYTKILTLNLSDPNLVVAREWLSIAVEDPGKTFGIERWDSPDPTRLKVYFKRQAENKNSFVMIGVVPS